MKDRNNKSLKCFKFKVNVTLFQFQSQILHLWRPFYLLIINWNFILNYRSQIFVNRICSIQNIIHFDFQTAEIFINSLKLSVRKNMVTSQRCCSTFKLLSCPSTLSANKIASDHSLSIAYQHLIFEGWQRVLIFCTFQNYLIICAVVDIHTKKLFKGKRSKRTIFIFVVFSKSNRHQKIRQLLNIFWQNMLLCLLQINEWTGNTKQLVLNKRNLIDTE